VTALVADYLADELDPATKAMFEGHVRGCVDCTAFLKTYRKTTEAIHSLRYEMLPADLQDRALEALRDKLKKAPRRR